MRSYLKFGISGVRGVVGGSFTPSLATTFAQAFGTFVGAGPVLVGRDTRVSGPMIEQAVVAGLLSVGCKPILLGVVPTPSLLYLTPYVGARGGIMITASHNGVEWNALKFVDRQGLFLNAIHAEELFDIYHQQEFPLVGESELRTVSDYPDPTRPHLNQVLRYVDVDTIRRARLKVVVDACNGVGAVHTQDFLEQELGCEVVMIHGEPSGVFEREPEPLPDHLTALSDAVRRTSAHLGFAQDPDGDRLAVVDERGRPIGEETTVVLAIKAVLDVHGRGPVVANQSLGKRVAHIAEEAGCPLTYTKTGEVHVSEAMRHVGAVAGGEHTGGIIVPAIHPCRDSYAGMAILLECIARTGQSITALRHAIPAYALVKAKLPIEADQAPAILRRLRKAYAEYPISTLDGICIDFGDRWVQIRRSNTEPVLRIIAEAPDIKSSNELVESIRDQIAV